MWTISQQQVRVQQQRRQQQRACRRLPPRLVYTLMARGAGLRGAPATAVDLRLNFAAFVRLVAAQLMVDASGRRMARSSQGGSGGGTGTGGGGMGSGGSLGGWLGAGRLGGPVHAITATAGVEATDRLCGCGAAEAGGRLRPRPRLTAPGGIYN
jgi:hypothetical protein